MQALELRLFKKSMIGMGETGNKILVPRRWRSIRLVEHSHPPVRRTLAKLGIPPVTFYRWYARLQAGGPEALENKPCRARRVWNSIPEEVREQMVQLALDEPEPSPREVATRFTDVKQYLFRRRRSRLVKAH